MIKINLNKSVFIKEISSGKKSYLIKKIEKINRKAFKLGCKPMVLTFGPEKRETVKHPETGSDFTKITCLAKLDYEVPIINGWELICRFDGMQGKNGLVVFTSAVPDKTIPAEWLNTDSIKCDHCKQNRFRNHSMLMHNIKTDEYKEVGSTCIKDFFGHDPKGFVYYSMFNWTDYFFGGECDFEGGEYDYKGQSYMQGMDDLGVVLAMTSACIDEFGWVSGKLAYEKNITSTKEMVSEQLNPPTVKYKGWITVEVQDNHNDLTAETLDYFRNLDPKEIQDNDYMMNCFKLVQADLVPWRKMGTAVSMINCYKRFCLGEIERKERKVSEYVGEIGDKIEVQITCVYETGINTQFGTSKLYIWIDDNGNVYKTFYSGCKWDMVKGETGLLKGTVKKHEEYKGSKNTMLTRCSVSDIVEIKEVEKAA